ncbi:MAG: LysM peptidoglycan-binding domain-containing protein [Alphaproteobacteria bacterium]|nr:LysM peptidoglycan-binding domain-containing protein [Alphaproteobacteria bacterium]
MAKDTRFARMGKVKKTTEEIMEEALAKHSRIAALWRKNRPSTPAVSNPEKRISEVQKTKSAPTPAPAPKPIVIKPVVQPSAVKNDVNRPPVRILGGGFNIKDYWFPILCVVAILALVIWAIIPSSERTERTVKTVVAQPIEQQIDGIAEPTVRVIGEVVLPSFDVVRIEQNGNLIVAGRYLPNQKVSIMINRQIVATENADRRGEFVYAPSRPLNPGNHIIRLIAVEAGRQSENNVFVYIPSDRNFAGALSLLMTADGSRVMQAPTLSDGDLVVRTIDYLENNRIVVTGRAIPRLRVTLTLNDTELGFARTSDHRNFMLGVPTQPLNPGETYRLKIRLHDTSGTTVAEVVHEFTMPEITPGDATYYTVRRGDALWIIARNFLGRGTRFTMIVDANPEIRNPDLIFPNQRLRIPIR